MCVAIIAAGLSIAQAAVGFAAAQQQADAQNQAYLDNARAAQKAAVNQYTNQNIRLTQEKAAADQKAQEQAKQALEARGSAQTSAGEAGVAGISPEAMIANLYGQEGNRYMALDANYQMTRQQIQNNMEDVMAQSQQRINSVQRAVQPNAASFLIQGLSGAVGAFNSQKGGMSIA